MFVYFLLVGNTNWYLSCVFTFRVERVLPTITRAVPVPTLLQLCLLLVVLVAMAPGLASQTLLPAAIKQSPALTTPPPPALTTPTPIVQHADSIGVLATLYTKAGMCLFGGRGYVCVI